MCNEKNITALHFSHFVNAKQIVFGNQCCQYVNEFVIDGLPRLRIVKIGENCFREVRGECSNGLCRIIDCPNLRQLEIGCNSFPDFRFFKLFNVNSLQSIKFGEHCFAVADLSLNGM